MDPFGNDSTELKELSIEERKPINRLALWKRLLIFFIILTIWLIIVIIIIVTVYMKKEEEEEEEEKKKQLEKYGEINCIFNINNLSENYSLLGDKFNKTNIDIMINNTKIDSKNYLFSKLGKNKVQFILYGNEFSMDYMFKDISNLINVEMISEKNMSITSMISSFENCKDLRYFSIKGFSTNNLKSMKKLFYKSHINNINLTNLDTKNVEDMSYMFAYTDFEEFDFNEKEIYINTENVKDMSYMFYGCENLYWMNLSLFNTSKVLNMSGMF